MVFSAGTLKMAVIGDPIEHSLSPFLHASVIDGLGIDAVYLPFRVSSEDTEKFHDAARYLGFSGFNATMPHKVRLMNIVDELDDTSRLYGSVNTVRIRNGVSRGYNTDVDGLLMALNHHGRSIRGSRIMMIGAGGVAGSLVRGFARAGASRITVLNRTLEKARRIIDGIPGGDEYGQIGCLNCSSNEATGAVSDPYRSAGPVYGDTVLSALLLEDENLTGCAENADIIINCTPLGMSGMSHDFEDLHFLDHTRALVCDLIYNPWKTRLLQYADSRGLDTMNGLDMLLYQGLLAFQIFTDISLDLRSEFQRIYPLCRDRLL